MSDNNDQKTKTSALSNVLRLAFGVDLLWAIVVATFNAILLSEAGNAFGGSTVGTIFGVALGWLISFVIAFIQGAIFMVVLGGFVAVFSILLSLPGKLRNKGQTQTPDNADKK